MDAATKASTQAPLTHAHQFLLNALSVALGILMAAGVIWAVHSAIHSGDEEACYRDNVSRSITGEPTKICG